MGRPKNYKAGEVLKIALQGVIYECPALPELDSIRNYDLEEKDQVWMRRMEWQKWSWNTDPKIGRVWTDIATPEQWEWYDSEIVRLHKGDWIWINGVPTYLNRYAYFFHQWFMLLHMAYPDYKDTSLEYFRFFEYCEKDRFTFGDLGIKGRRVGLSSMSAAIKALISILDSNTISGIVSKTGTDAQEMYFMVRNGIENLPPFLMPEINNITDGEIHIGKKQFKNKLYTEKGKNNRVNWLDTSEKAYDGRAMRHITIDEAGKMVKANVRVLLSKISDTLIRGAQIVGKVSVFSTVDKGDQGGDNFKEIWDGSDHISGKLNKYGQTKTKLKRFFLPAYRGYLGYIGKYGESIIEKPTKAQTEWLKTHDYYNPVSDQMEKCPDPYIGAKEWLQVTRDMLSDDPEMLAEEKRKNPFEWKEVFEGANNQCCFDADAINRQKAFIQEKLENTGKKENGRRVSFKKLESGEKIWFDDPKGLWFIIKFPDIANRFVYKGNIKCPNNTEYGAAGLDPIAHARKTVDKGSDACLIIHERYNALDPENSNMPVAMFLGKTPIKTDLYNQIFWGLEYYGIQVLGEISPSDWIDYATDRDLASPQESEKKHGYLLTRKLSNGQEEYGVAPQGGDAKEQHVTEMKEYSVNNISKIGFIRLLDDMLLFNVKERTDYDACMAWGYALMALKAHQPKPVVQRKNKLVILHAFRRAV